MPVHLDTLLQQQTDALDALCTLLDDEANALAAADPAPLEALNQRKLEQLAQLRVLGEQLSQALTELCGSADPADQKRWLQETYAPTAPERWSRWHAAAERARERNELNGRRIEGQLKQQQQALDVLLPRPTDDATAYGANGRTANRPTPTTRSRGSA